MALRRFTHIADDGYLDEQDAADSLELGGLTMSGDVAMGSNKVTGVAAATAAGDALVYGQTGASLTGLALTDDLTMGGNGVTGAADAVNATDLVTKQQLDNAVSGMSWKDPVEVINMLSDADQGGSAPSSPSTGEAYVVNNWGGSYNNGDIVEYDGSAWQVIVSNSGGEPPDETRVVVAGPPGGTLGGSFTGHSEAVATYDTTGSSWSFTSPSDGWAVLVIGDSGVNEDLGFNYNDTDWVQFTGAGQINAGNGLSKSGNTLNVNFGDGIQNASDYVAVELASSNPGLTLTGTTPNKQLAALADGNAGIEITSGGIAVDLAATTPGLEFDGSGDLQAKVDTTAGLEITANGIGVDISTSNPGLHFDGSGDLQGLASSTGGLQIGVNGFEVNIDDTPDTLDADASGLKVVGLPSQFKINDTQVGATVTAANLDTLTDGSNADTLHTHSGANTAQHIANSYTAGEALSAGDPVYLDGTNDQVSKADAATASKRGVMGVASAAVSSGSSGDVVSYGPASGALSGATAGQIYFLASGGGLATSPPSGPGTRFIVRVGWAVNATTLWVQPELIGRRR